MIEVAAKVRTIMAWQTIGRSVSWITCRRGVITVLNRPALEAHVCECDAAVKSANRRLIG